MKRVEDHQAQGAGGRVQPARAGVEGAGGSANSAGGRAKGAGGRAKRLVVPVALTVVTLGAVASLGGALVGLAASAGCDDGTHVDAAVDSAFDAAPDTPIV